MVNFDEKLKNYFKIDPYFKASFLSLKKTLIPAIDRATNAPIIALSGDTHSLQYFQAILILWSQKKRVALLSPLWGVNEKKQATKLLGEYQPIDLFALPQNMENSPIQNTEIDQDWDFYDYELIIFTSGSSGKMKAVVHRKKNLDEAILSYTQSFSFERNIKSIMSLSQHHIGGLMIGLRAIFLEQEILFIQGNQLIKQIFELEKKKESYLISLVPTQLSILLEQLEKDNIKQLLFAHAIFVGGASFSHELQERAKKRKLNIIACYGMSESTAMVMLSFLSEKEDQLAPLIYRQMPGREISLADDGQITFGPYGMMAGYLEGGILKTLPPNKRFITNDIGVKWEKGFEIKGRSDLIFISGGENIDPEEIEQALREIDHLSFALVIAIDDPKWGQIGIAFIFDQQEKLSKTAIERSLTARLLKYKWPKHYYKISRELFQREIEGRGKVSRQFFREMASRLKSGDWLK